MNNLLDIVLLLTRLAEGELAQDDKNRMSRVVVAHHEALETIRDDLWQAGQCRAATQVDRLISGFHPACQPPIMVPAR